MKYFTIHELTQTTHGLNVPNDVQIKNLKLLVEKVLDPAREELKAPIRITSGFRTKEINEIIGGAKNSQHVNGQAADLVCYDNKKLFLILQGMEFDQLIYEFGNDNQPGWVHVSFSNVLNRNQVLRARKSKGKTIYEKIN